MLKDWKPVDVIILILASAIALGLLLGSAHSVFTGIPPTDVRSAIISDIVNTALSIIAIYVGARIKERLDEGRERRERNENV